MCQIINPAGWGMQQTALTNPTNSISKTLQDTAAEQKGITPLNSPRNKMFPPFSPAQLLHFTLPAMQGHAAYAKTAFPQLQELTALTCSLPA